MRRSNLLVTGTAIAALLAPLAAHAQQPATGGAEPPAATQEAPAAGAGAQGAQGTPITQDATGQTGADQGTLHPEAQLEVAEEHTTVTLDAPDPHRLYVLDPVFPHLIASKVWVYNGDDGKLLGMMNTGYVPNMALSPDHGSLYVAETFWSRGARGERADVVTTYDPRTLSPTGEVILPRGRFLVVTKRHGADVSPDGRYFYSFNMAPLTAISVVDLQENAYKGEIEIPGCALVFPTGERAFASLCADGSLLTATFDEGLTADVKRSDPFFDAENDPVFEHVGFDRENKVLHMVSYSGRHYSADLSGDEPVFSEPWDFVSEEERTEGWRPGGWQLMSFHAATGKLYVIMHEGEDWTHKAAGEQVWELDVEAKEVSRKIELEEEAMSIAVSRDDQPILAALSESASVVVYDLASGEPRSHIEEIGDSPFILMLEGN